MRICSARTPRGKAPLGVVILALCSIVRVAPAHGEPIELEADSLTYEKDGGVLTAEGDVRLKWNDNLLTAGSVTFERTARRLLGTGGLVLDTPALKIEASSCDLDLDDETGVLTDMRGALKGTHVSFGGRTVRKHVGLRYTLEDGYFTTCMTKEGERPDWELSVARLTDVIRHQPDAFAPKHRWAMDWYYPVLAGVITGEAGRERLADRRDTFMMEGKGLRCVSDRPWVTAAESCECALAHLVVGEDEIALELYRLAQTLRADNGQYWTGIVYPELVHFPGNERSTYTAAAVILTADAISQTSPASGLFTDPDLLPQALIAQPEVGR